ncbi:MAG: hypothetical protein MMC33_006232 [Icmadophila ericetorum]|nr:hypothetical protein [Icmadophila ericetorum]
MALVEEGGDAHPSLAYQREQPDPPKQHFLNQNQATFSQQPIFQRQPQANNLQLHVEQQYDLYGQETYPQQSVQDLYPNQPSQTYQQPFSSSHFPPPQYPRQEQPFYSSYQVTQSPDVLVQLQMHQPVNHFHPAFDHPSHNIMIPHDLPHQGNESHIQGEGPYNQLPPQLYRQAPSGSSAFFQNAALMYQPAASDFLSGGGLTEYNQNEAANTAEQHIDNRGNMSMQAGTSRDEAPSAAGTIGTIEKMRRRSGLITITAWTRLPSGKLVEKSEHFTPYCGIATPAIHNPPVMTKVCENRKDDLSWKAICGLCGGRFRAAGDVKDHFYGCVERNGNPSALSWNHDKSCWKHEPRRTKTSRSKTKRQEQEEFHDGDDEEEICSKPTKKRK